MRGLISEINLKQSGIRAVAKATEELSAAIRSGDKAAMDSADSQFELLHAKTQTVMSNADIAVDFDEPTQPKT